MPRFWSYALATAMTGALSFFGIASAQTVAPETVLPAPAMPAPALSAPVLVDKTPAGEIAFWNSVKDSTDPSEFRTYLENFPNGMFFDPALSKFDEHKGDRAMLSKSVLQEASDQ